MALVFHISVPLLLLPIRFTTLAMLAIKATAAYAGVWLAYRLIDLLADYLLVKAEKTESKLDDQLIPLIAKTLKVFVSVVGGIFILQNLDVNVGSLLAGLGLGGLAFALAAKDTIANFFGSIMIFIDKPFQIGDWVVIASTEGIIEEVGFRTSRVRTFHNSLVTVPNAMITSTIVDNYGARKYRRYTTNLGLTYDTPPDKVEAFCEGVRAIIAGMPGMRKDYYLVEFREFGASSLVIMVYCFMIAKTWNEELRIRTHLNLEILRLAENLGVGFAFPTQTLHVSSLAQPGQSIPGHRGPENHAELAAIIAGFGPRGPLARPEGLTISHGYDCGTEPPGSGDARGT
jgi:MscS family membrane protein